MRLCGYTNVFLSGAFKPYYHAPTIIGKPV
jgi:hypothetical protein